MAAYAHKDLGLPPELATALMAALNLYPWAFPDERAFLLEAVSRLTGELARDEEGRFKARGIDYDSVRILLERWLTARSQTAPAQADDRAYVTEPPDAHDSSTLSDRSAAPSRILPVPASDGSGTHLSALTETAIVAPTAGVAIEANGEQFDLETGPLFGLHNRDYPSLWAAAQLYELAAEGPVDLAVFLQATTTKAWEYARSLSELEPGTGRRKLAALFPSNQNRKRSSEEGFRTFAIGSIHAVRAEPGRKRLAGPLYQWQLARLVSGVDDAISIGRTAEGERLLGALSGLSLDTPHSPEHADAFLTHLMEFAPGDWEVFSAVLSLCSASPSRAELISGLQEQFDTLEWSDSAASSYAVGYVGRAREWGLLDEQLTRDRTYRLTELGHDYVRA